MHLLDLNRLQNILINLSEITLAIDSCESVELLGKMCFLDKQVEFVSWEYYAISGEIIFIQEAWIKSIAKAKLTNFEYGNIFKVTHLIPKIPILFAETTILYDYISSEDEHPEIPIYGFEAYNMYLSIISQILGNPRYSSIGSKREPLEGSQFPIYSSSTRLMSIWDKSDVIILLTINQPDEFEFNITIQGISARNFSINAIGFN